MAPVYDIAQRAQALTLKINGFSNAEITSQTGISARGVQDLLRRARDRGFDPRISMTIKKEYVIDGKRSGRPRKGAIQTEATDERHNDGDAPTLEDSGGFYKETGPVGALHTLQQVEAQQSHSNSGPVPSHDSIIAKHAFDRMKGGQTATFVHATQSQDPNDETAVPNTEQLESGRSVHYDANIDPRLGVR